MRFWAWETDFIYFKESRLAAAPTQLLLNVQRGGGVQTFGRKPDHSLPYSSKVKNLWSYSSTCFHVREQDTFTCRNLVNNFQKFPSH